jgi:hypothetical protein
MGDHTLALAGLHRHERRDERVAKDGEGAS